MKIWIDTRVKAQSPYYHLFIQEIIEEIAQTPSEHEFYVFIEAWERENSLVKKLPHTPHIKTILLKKQSSIVKKSLQDKKIFQAENFHMMVFFWCSVPYGYKRPYIIIMESLKEIFFPRKEWLARKIYTFQLKNAVKNSFKILTLDKYSPLELNDHLNISEDKLADLSWFFPQFQKVESPLETDITLKHNLKSPYFLYDSENEIHNNFDIILKSLKHLKDTGTVINLLIISDTTTHDLDIRAKVIDLDLHTQVHFIGNTDEKLVGSYYKQALGVIFTSIYESFPFWLTKALAYKAQILANDIPAYRDVLWDTIIYISPYSHYKTSEVLFEIFQRWDSKKTPDISKIWSAKDTVKKLLYFLEH